METNHSRDVLAFPSVIERETVRLHPIAKVPSSELSRTQTLALLPSTTDTSVLFIVTFASENIMERKLWTSTQQVQMKGGGNMCMNTNGELMHNIKH